KLHSNTSTTPPTPTLSHTYTQPSLPSFLFNHTTTTEIYTLSLHDALPILFHPAHRWGPCWVKLPGQRVCPCTLVRLVRGHQRGRSEEHTSELQSRENLVCRLLLEKKKNVQ